ncbi:hypothetical protein [Bacillus alkalicellulosilyticus]|uniref:hypothetical protein n=1 Tax=Alkalihalobacterium alkalicellulosilyticum TaxID=1912214 RepID=UPI000998CFB9|nr:hypothetical protein [Bacillus alkalicellulosilyticus]
MDLKKAYEVLGIAETATNQELEAQYLLLIRQHKAESNKTNEEPFSLEEVNRAYSIAWAHINKDDEFLNPKDTRRFNHPLLKKLDHFFYYYKYHTLAAVLFIIVLVTSIQGFLDHKQEQAVLDSLPPEDVSMMFVGDYYISDIDRIADYISANVPDWERISIDLSYSPLGEDAVDVAAIQKSAVILATHPVDVYVLDYENFDRLNRTGAFVELEPSHFNEPVSENRFISGQTEDDAVEKVYGIDITDSSIFNGHDVRAEVMIAAVRLDRDHFENSIKLIEQFLAE